MTIAVRIATRDWDYLTPLFLGDVVSKHVDLKIERVDNLGIDLAASPYDGAETSFSRYVSMRQAGGSDVVGLPLFLMRGFRHRCIVTTTSSPLTRLSDLAGKRIGLSGWRDSGHVWTRAALRHAGVGIEDVRWYLGAREGAAGADPLDGFGRPGRIEALAPGQTLLGALKDGGLDAAFLPFAPPEMFGPEAGVRPLVSNWRAAERNYGRDFGFVPGIHLLSLKVSVIEAHPWLPAELIRLFDESAAFWTQRRRRYAETTPWLLEGLIQAARDLPPAWNASGFGPNRAMIEAFVSEMAAQGVLPRPITAEALFPVAEG